MSLYQWFLHKFLCFSGKDKQKIDFVRPLTKIYLMQNVTVRLKICNHLKGLQLFSSSWKGRVDFYQWIFYLNFYILVKKVIKNSICPTSYQNTPNFIFESQLKMQYLLWKPEFFKLPVAKKSYLRKKKVSRVAINYETP